ncbi:MAG: DUF4386 domain-containing protein [Pseudomonadota bacterium]
MNNAATPTPNKGLSQRQAALIAGFGLLAMVATAPVAEFAIFPKIIVDGDIAATLANISQNPNLFLYGIFCHFVTYAADIFVAWGLYFLFRPVAPAHSLLVAWFRLIYTAVAFVGLLNLFKAYHLATEPEYAAALGASQIEAHALVLIESFHQIWMAAFVLFGAHLVLLGALIIRTNVVPSIVGVAVAAAGFGYLVDSLTGYFMPTLEIGWIFFVLLGELVLMLWLLIFGWFLKEPTD